MFLTNSYVVSICCNPDLRRLPAWVVVYILKGVFTKKKKKSFVIIYLFFTFSKTFDFFCSVKQKIFWKNVQNLNFSSICFAYYRSRWPRVSIILQNVLKMVWDKSQKWVNNYRIFLFGCLTRGPHFISNNSNVCQVVTSSGAILHCHTDMKSISQKRWFSKIHLVFIIILLRHVTIIVNKKTHCKHYFSEQLHYAPHEIVCDND